MKRQCPCFLPVVITGKEGGAFGGDPLPLTKPDSDIREDFLLALVIYIVICST
jgi:hypothetical protein